MLVLAASALGLLSVPVKSSTTVSCCWAPDSSLSEGPLHRLLHALRSARLHDPGILVRLFRNPGLALRMGEFFCSRVWPSSGMSSSIRCSPRARFESTPSLSSSRWSPPWRFRPPFSGSHSQQGSSLFFSSLEARPRDGARHFQRRSRRDARSRGPDPSRLRRLLRRHAYPSEAAGRPRFGGSRKPLAAFAVFFGTAVCSALVLWSLLYRGSRCPSRSTPRSSCRLAWWEPEGRAISIRSSSDRGDQ